MGMLLLTTRHGSIWPDVLLSLPHVLLNMCKSLARLKVQE
jgi:hypothetical protein